MYSKSILLYLGDKKIKPKTLPNKDTKISIKN